MVPNLSLRPEVVNRKGKQKAPVTSKVFLTYKQFRRVFREFGYVLLTTCFLAASALWGRKYGINKNKINYYFF